MSEINHTNTATVKLKGTAEAVQFGKAYRSYSVWNNSSDTVHFSTFDPECTKGADGVVPVPPNGSVDFPNGLNDSPFVYVRGSSGEVVIIAKDAGGNSFGAVGSVSSGSSEGGTSPGTTSNEDWKAELDRIYGSR